MSHRGITPMHVNAAGTAHDVLVVEDERECLVTMIEALDGRGFKCCGAASATEAISTLRKELAVSVVVTDVRMPGMNGLDLIQEVRGGAAEKRDIEFIVVSGRSGLDEAVRAVRLHAFDFLQKPIDIVGLSDAVRRAREAVATRHFDRYLKASLALEAAEHAGHAAHPTRDFDRALETPSDWGQEHLTGRPLCQEFLRILHHELRRPMDTIASSAKVLRYLMTDEANRRKNDLLDEVLAAAGRELKIMDTISDPFASESGNTHLSLGKVNMYELVQRVAERYETKAGNSGIRIEISPPTELSVFDGVEACLDKATRIEINGADELPAVLGDERQLGIAIGHLMSNAITSSQADSVIRIACSSDGKALRVSVSDEGIGMAPEEIDLALAPFQRLRRLNTPAENGIGLGLTLARLVVTLHGGALTLSSERGVGTTAAIDLPLGKSRFDGVIS